MLQSISWVQFGSFLLVANSGYYLYVLVRYYRAEITSFFSGKGRVQKALKKSGAPEAPQGGASKVESVQPGLFGGGLAQPDPAPTLFMVMEKVIVLLKGVVSKGVAEGISREDLLGQLSDVLAKYGQLKGTPYQDGINNFLTRTCSSNFSLLLGEDELDVLWN